MSELPDLPRVSTRVRPVPVGGLEAAVRNGRRRRNGFLGVLGGGLTATAVVVVAVAGSSGTGTQSLVPATPRQRATSAAPAAPMAQAQAAHRRQLAASAAADARRVRGGTGAVGPVPAASALPAPGAASPAPRATGGPRQHESYREAPRDVAAPAECQQAPTGSAGPIYYGGASGCSTSSGGPSTVRRGGSVSGTADICVPHGGSATELGYSSGREHDVVVTNAAGDTVYRFSSTVTFPQGAHRRNVGEGRCLEWTGTWDTRTTGGELVAAGRYEVRVILLPDSVGGQRVSPGSAGSSGFSVDVH